MRVLVIEDDPATAEVMRLQLQSDGYTVQTVALGEEGANLALRECYDAITLDLNLPDIDGLAVLRRIRLAKITTPILIVTGTNTIDMKVRALTSGADDYITKPWHREELNARLQALVRRSCGEASPTIEVGPLSLDLGERRVRINGRPLHLTGSEYSCLELMMLRRGATLTKDSFLNHLYGGRDEPEIKIIDVFICKLRKKLTEAGAPELIHTVWGRGYVLSDVVEAA